MKMERLTEINNGYACRIKNCWAEDWMGRYYAEYPRGDICKDCPFMELVNKLAGYEDKEEE
jgi:hypothetical protein